jgi:thioredoxin reductase (NADPH)
MNADILIIGAGPVGLFSVFACGQRDLNCIVVDTLEQQGGQCISLYPDKPIYDIPARRSIAAGELIEELLAQAAPYEPRYLLGDCVTTISEAGSGWLVQTQKGVAISCGAIIIAGGNGLFEPVRPSLDELEKYEGRSVFYSVKKREEFAGKRLVIAGGGDSALDWAIALSGISAKCYLVHRRPRFRGAPATIKLLEKAVASNAVEVIAPGHLSGLKGADGILSGVKVRSGAGEERVVDANVLLAFYGLRTSLGPLAAWGLEIVDGKVVVEPGTCSTNRPGIFAIGDIAHYSGKLGLILTGFAEAAAAAHAAYAFVRPEVVFNFMHSTTRGDPALRPREFSKSVHDTSPVLQSSLHATSSESNYEVAGGTRRDEPSCFTREIFPFAEARRDEC